MTSTIADRIKAKARRTVEEIRELDEKLRQGRAKNAANRAQVQDHSRALNRERESERAFIRSFGDKVTRYRLSNRADFVGLLIVGKYSGLLVTGDEKGNRKLRIIDVDKDGKIAVTKRYLRLKDNESISNLQRGLLRWVR